MLVKIQTSDKSDGNKGSSYALVTYLEKYDIEKEKKSLSQDELPEPRAGFFNQFKDGLTKSEVAEMIDTNKKGLGKKDAKFYSLTIAPSQDEIKTMLQLITDKPVNAFEDLDTNQVRLFEDILKKYSRDVMNIYAKHFKRKDLNSGSQIVYAGKIEHYREYKGTDENVLNGSKKVGEKKPGFHSHVHFVISRKDVDMKYKLSPLANEKGNESNSMLNGKKVQRGFDRTLFSIKCEKLFDEQFKHNRRIENQVIYKIEASKNKNISINLETDPVLKEILKQELVNNFIKKNNYQKETYVPKKKLNLIKKEPKIIIEKPNSQKFISNKTKNSADNFIDYSDSLISDVDKKKKRKKRKR